MNYSANLLRTMGTSAARDLVTENHHSSQQKLWRHVVLNAIEDTHINNSDRKSSLVKLDAHKWLCNSQDFDKICWWAGWDPTEIKHRYKTAIRKEEIKFNTRQLKWKIYNDTYEAHKNETDRDRKKMLRIKVVRLRTEVMNCPIIWLSNIYQEVKA